MSEQKMMRVCPYCDGDVVGEIDHCLQCERITEGETLILTEDEYNLHMGRVLDG